MNNFYSDLETSHAASSLPIWETIYRKHFPTFLSMTDHRQKGDHQKLGVDRSIVLGPSTHIRIDEKVRWRAKNGRVYEDIALEEFSSWESQTPGWVVKPLLSDYIAYLIAPLGRCYLLPVPQLQSAWILNRDKWRQPGSRIEAKNPGYTTLSWAVSVDELYPAIGKTLRTEFIPFEKP